MKHDKPISRLMREGAAATKPCTMAFCLTKCGLSSGPAPVARTCAIGAAAYAYAADENINCADLMNKSSRMLTALTFHTLQHPVTGHLSAANLIVVSLNDLHHWTREQIADWLESNNL